MCVRGHVLPAARLVGLWLGGRWLDDGGDGAVALVTLVALVAAVSRRHTWRGPTQ